MSSESLESVGGSRRLRLFVETGGTVLLAIIVARLIWLVLAPGASLSSPQSTAATFSPSASRIAPNPPDRSVLIKSNPFVRSAIAASVSQSPVDEGLNAPETELNLKLTGIRALSGSDGASSGSVWIVKPDGQEVIVGVGETIIDGVTLEQIYSDRVTIRSRGRLESLLRRDDADGFLDRSTTSDTTVASSQPTSSPQVAEGEPVGALALYNSTDFSQITEGGTVIGYRLSPRGSGAAFRQAGFQSGDILLSLNGMSVDLFEDGDFVAFFADQSRMLAVVDREGVEVTIRLTLTEDT
ncbi:MAG: type II secretion system protein N [Pseudomonadota bacterium]